MLPKSTREAAHSPPRHRTKVPIPSSPPPLADEENMSSSLPQSQIITSSEPISETNLVTVDDTKIIVHTQKTNPKMIKQRSFSTKTIYRSTSGMTTSRSSEQTDSNSVPRMSKSFFCL